MFAEAFIEVYKDDTMLATTSIWEEIRTYRNKLKNP
jgi:hypothetical protein